MAGVAPLIVLSGPSGVGKTTLVDRLMACTRLKLRRAVTATTRPPRAGEIPGIHYHFWSVPEFRAAIDAGAMLEYAVVHGRDYYGTPRSEVDPHRADGVGVILVIDVQGAEQVRRQKPAGLLTVFVAPPTFEELRGRLEGRGSEDPVRLARRLETARAEMERAAEFDCRVVNDDLDHAASALETVVAKQFAAKPKVAAH